MHGNSAGVLKTSPSPTLAAVGLLGLGIMLALGCTTAATYADVSAQLAYRELTGARYELRVPMHLSGVNAPPGYEKTIDFYTVSPASPGWSGPELVSRCTLPPGTWVAVRGVRRCTNCPFETRVEALVEIAGVTVDARFPVSISLEYLAPEFARRHPDAANAPAHRNAGGLPDSSGSPDSARMVSPGRS